MQRDHCAVQDRRIVVFLVDRLSKAAAVKNAASWQFEIQVLGNELNQSLYTDPVASVAPFSS